MKHINTDPQSSMDIFISFFSEEFYIPKHRQEGECLE